jgi:hypothetical protein
VRVRHARRGVQQTGNEKNDHHDLSDERLRTFVIGASGAYRGLAIMPTKSYATEDPASRIASPCSVMSVEKRPGFILRVEFVEGTSGEVEMRHLIEGQVADVFSSLRDTRTFMKARVKHGAVIWPGEIDLARYPSKRAVGSRTATRSPCSGSSLNNELGVRFPWPLRQSLGIGVKFGPEERWIRVIPREKR